MITCNNRYGLRQLLFLEGLQEDSLFVQRGYKRELDKAFRNLAFILLPSFFVELAHKIIFFSTVTISFPYLSASVALNATVFVFVLASWVYRTGVFLLVCVLFRLTCELQILRFEGLHKMFEGCESDCGEIFKQHHRIRKQLSETSHRYRLFIIACMVTITVSQFGALLLVLASKSEKTFFNSGDLVVSENMSSRNLRQRCPKAVNSSGQILQDFDAALDLIHINIFEQCRFAQ